MNSKNNQSQAIGTTKENKRLLIFLAVLAVLVGFSSATQYLAHALAYQELLGFNLHGFYEPFAIIRWSFKWYEYMPDIFNKAHSIGLLITTFGLFGVTITKFMLLNSAKANEHLHGSARWANSKDIIEAELELIPNNANASQKTGEGVYVGGFTDKGKTYYLRDNGAAHVLTFAPTRSGKGVGLVIPTLLSWTKSCVITDLKGELWELTSGWRKQYANNKVLRFEPATSTGCARWNPLSELRIGTDAEVGDVQNLANLIVDPDGKGLNDHWAKTSFALLVGVILHLKYKEKNNELFDLQNKPCEATMAMLDAFLADPTKDAKEKETWREMINYPHIRPSDDENTWKTHPAVATAGKDMLDRPEKEAGSVLSVTKSFLSLYRDPVVAQNTAVCDFRIKDLMHHDHPVSLYIVTQPNDKERLRPLVRLMISMVVRLLADKMDFENGRPKAHYKHRLLMMIDEFPSLGKLDILQESLAFVAGYGIKCYLICQDLNQLKRNDIGYGQDESITSNCHIQNAYAPNRIETAEHLSKLTGQTTIIKEQITTSGKRASAMHSQVSRTLQETQRPLLTADEARTLKKPKKNQADEIIESGDMLIFVAGMPAIKGTQILYFKDNFFSKASAVQAPERSDVIG